MEPVFVIGATGKVGSSLIRRLAGKAIPAVAIGRSGERLSQLPASDTRIADPGDEQSMHAALAGARVVGSYSHTDFIPAMLGAAPSGLRRIVALGSTRKFTHYPDVASEGVIRLIVDGEPNKVIARRLEISFRTVEIHRARVMQKMQARSLSDLVRMVITLEEAAKTR